MAAFGTFRTWPGLLTMSVLGGEADFVVQQLMSEWPAGSAAVRGLGRTGVEGLPQRVINSEKIAQPGEFNNMRRRQNRAY